MPLRPGSSMILLALYYGPRDATQVHQYIFGPIRPQQPNEHLKSKLLDLLQLKMLRKSVNASGSSPNAAHTGSSMTPSTTSL
ncbi:hypothetical protein EV715DRAFT_289894 [Schizophyllum commune]